jgi:DMSO/TMAO reductase YedYZ heme-binding membrane subunit
MAGGLTLPGLLAATGPSAYWYMTRGTGVVALLLLTAVTALGVATSTGLRTSRLPRFAVAGLHRNLTLLAIAFVAAHVLTTLADGFAPIGLRDALIPFLSPYRPVWLGLGAVAFDLLLALVVTSLLRARIGLRLWRGIHWLAYIAWPVALLHTLGTGSDARTGWVGLLAYGSIVTVTVAALWRIAAAHGTDRGIRIAAACVAAAVPVALVVWYRDGPMQRGWAARAGTPPRLLASAAVPPARRAARAVRSNPPSRSFSARLSGTLSQAGSDDGRLVTISILARLKGGGGGSLRLLLRGTPLDGGGVSMTASGVSLSHAGQVYMGQIVGLDGGRVAARLHDSTGRGLDLVLLVQARAGHVAGFARGGPPGAFASSEGLGG